MSHNAALEKISISRITKMIVSNPIEGDYYRTYLAIRDAVFHNDQASLGHLEFKFPFNDMCLAEAQYYIEDEAARMIYDYIELLDMAKVGLIESAIDGTLDSDMGQTDMKLMVGIAQEIEDGRREAQY